MKEQGIPKANESMFLFSCYGKLVVIKLLSWKSMIITDKANLNNQSKLYFKMLSWLRIHATLIISYEPWVEKWIIKNPDVLQREK